ncbi:hypothetical protein WMF31_27630 [Sorangium sp. So ce1036]|uniref:hypothetical protein n=1 Tax=Sorangium sp. So ce1036 TaxID=3133328 RepID=UPI003F06049C
MTDIIAQDEPRDIERLVDRCWFLLRSGRSRFGAGGTQVVRDGEHVVVSVDAAALGWPEGTLLFRFRSETAPCVACVDRAVALARPRTDGMLTTSDVREMLRFAVARCAVARIDLAHETAQASRPAGAGQGSAAEQAAPGDRRTTKDAGGDARRRDAELWLVL